MLVIVIQSNLVLITWKSDDQ